MPIGTKEHSLKAEYRLKIRVGEHLPQFVDLRTPAMPGADYLFHVSNSQVKVDPKFVTDNLERVLAAFFATDVEDGHERIAAREAVIDLGGGDLAHFQGHRLRIFSSSLERASNRLAQILDAYRIAEVPEKACFEIIKPGIAGNY